MPLLLALLAAPLFLSAQIRWELQRHPLPARIAGAMPHYQNPSRTLLWGDGLWQLDWKNGSLTKLSPGRYRAPGCWFGNGLVLLEEPGHLVWIRGNQRRLIDTQAEFSDCLETDILGETGLLLTHRGLQVRFYQPGPDGHWPYTEIYSFYTASYQSGLLQAPVDADRHPDLFAGNYWIQSPTAFNLPWRLFAINTYNDQPEAAHLRLALIRRPGRTRPALLAAQGQLTPGKLALFDAPPDVKQLWTETRLDTRHNLAKPNILSVADLDKDGLDDFVLGETAGEFRLWWWRQVAGSFTPTVIDQGQRAIAGWTTNVDKDGRPDVVILGEEEIRWYRNRPPLQ